MKKIKKIFILLFFSLILTSCFNNNEKTNNNLDSNQNTQMENIQTLGLQNDDIVAIMKTTNGTIKIKLFTTLVPETTTNFIGLAKKGYYDGIIFHRVINNFMIQTGDPTGTGMGGESIYGKQFEDEFNKNLKNIPYSVSMANSGPNTNGSQFFINQVQNSHLDNRHSVFGQVVEGKENVDKIAKTKTGEGDKPEKEIKIINIEIKKYEDGNLVDFDFDTEKEIKRVEELKKIEKEAKKDKKIEIGDIVGVNYVGKYENGEVFDSSIERGQAIDFTVGSGMLIKGFENGVIGMKIGEKKTLTLPPEEAYGEYDETKFEEVTKDKLQSFVDAGIGLETGAILPTQAGNFKILDIDGDNVKIDTNHMLAGKTLIFDIEIMDIK